MNAWGRLGAMMAFLSLVPNVASADCITLPVDVAARLADTVFSGTVTSVTADPASPWPSDVVAFTVDRVWKGPVTKRFVLRNFTRTPERFDFEIGSKYVVLAHKQTAEERSDLGSLNSAAETYVVGQCGDGTRAFTTAQAEVHQLGVGRLPD